MALIAIMTSPVSAPALAATPTCQNTASDADGDGWGWENNRSCTALVETTSSTTTPITTRSSSKQSYPACSSATFDQDGDGYGWENHRSCVFSASTNNQPTTTTTATTTTTSQSRYPSCISSDADDNGDGWGYENNSSCRVTVSTQSGTTGVSGNTATAPASNNNGHPVCSSLVTDDNNDGWGYENNRSCIAVPATAAANGPSTGTPQDNNPTLNNSSVIFNQTFGNETVGLYQGDQLNNSWNSPLWHLGFDQGRVKIITDTDAQKGKVMEVTYPAGAYGANGASAFLSDIQFGMNLPESYDELYIAYDIKFDNDFEFVLGGKLPGLCGYDSNQAPATGCNTGGGFPSGYDGWSARGMWRADGALENYVYQANQRNYYGDEEKWNTNAIPGTWHRIQHRVVLNTVGQKNGILEAWFDNAKVLSKNTLEYRKTESIGINLFYFSTFFGGNNSSWAPSTDQRVYFDNFVISTRKIQ